MLLNEQEIKDAVGFTTDQMTAYRRIESAVREKLNPRVAEIEAVLRECRDALECVPKHFGMKRLGNSTLTDSETRVKCHKAIAKIDEVLHGKE